MTRSVSGALSRCCGVARHTGRAGLMWSDVSAALVSGVEWHAVDLIDEKDVVIV